MKLLTKIKELPRLRWGLIYVVLAIIFFIIFLIWHHHSIWEALKQNFSKIIWCASFSFFGIGVGLINSRERPLNKEAWFVNWYYLLCFSFYWLISTIAAFLALLNIQNIPAAYASSALIGIIIGFTGDTALDKLLDLIKKLIS